MNALCLEDDLRAKMFFSAASASAALASRSPACARASDSSASANVAIRASQEIY